MGTAAQQYSTVLMKVSPTSSEEMFGSLQLGRSGGLNITCVKKKQLFSVKSGYGQKIFSSYF